MSYAAESPRRHTARCRTSRRRARPARTWNPATCWSTRVEASFSCTSPARLHGRTTGQCSRLAAGAAPTELTPGSTDASRDGPADASAGERPAPPGPSTTGREPRWAETTAPVAATTSPIAATTRKPRCQPPWSMAKPAIGAPRAEPVVIAEPCHPIISPRNRSGTSRLSCSTVAVMVGAHSTPQTVMRTAKLGTPAASATGAVSRARPPRSQ